MTSLAKIKKRFSSVQTVTGHLGKLSLLAELFVPGGGLALALVSKTLDGISGLISGLDEAELDQ